MINVTGGSFNCAGQMILGYCNDGEGRYGVPTTGTANVSGGVLTAGSIYLGGCDNSQSFTGGYGAVNISGSGVVATGGIMSDAVSGNGPYFAALGEQVNFDGGTLRAMSSNAAFINPNGCTNFHVRINAGGATIDSNGFDIGLPLALEAGTTTGGGLTKTGAGNLTLANANTYTSPTNINAGQLTLLTGTPFTGASANTVNVATGAALGVAIAGGATPSYTATATNTNLVFANNSLFAPTTDGSGNVTDLLSKDLNAAGQIVVHLAAPRSFSLTPTPLTNVEVLHAATVSKAPASVIPRFADVGAMDVSVAYSSTGATNGSITLTTVNGAARGWLGAGDNNWSDASGVNWGFVDGVGYDPAPNSVNARAWFTDSAAPVSNICVLDMNATVNSMLFYANGSPFAGYDIQKTGAGATQAITLSAIGSTISSETEIQVLGGVNSIEPDVKLASTPMIFVDKNSQLTISGALLQPGATAGLTIVGGALTAGGTDVQGTLVLSSTASNYTGPVSIDNAIVSAGYLTPGTISLRNNATLAYSGSSGEKPQQLRHVRHEHARCDWRRRSHRPCGQPKCQLPAVDLNYGRRGHCDS